MSNLTDLTIGHRICAECGALMVRVLDKATGKLIHYRCLGCKHRFVFGLPDDLQTELSDVTTHEDLVKDGISNG